MRTWLGVVAALLASVAVDAAAQNLVLNPSFETGDTTSWTQSGGGCTFDVQAPPAASTGAGGFPAQAPIAGAIALNPDATAPGVCQLFQDIALPAGNTYQLSFAAGYNYADLGGDPTGAGCSATVELQTTGGVNIATYFAAAGGANQPLVNRGTFALPPGVAGTTVRVALTWTSCPGGPTGIPADAFSLTAGGAALGARQVPTLSEWSLLLLALMVAGGAIFTARRRNPS
jgi:hypothetical protein